MGNDDLISVIIPIYNCEKYLDRCINSVINQTYKNLEVILVDDGSTDSSGLICDRYLKKDKRIKVFHTSNGGLSAARNYGIGKAKASYIGFVDSDDQIDTYMYETLYNNLINNNADLSVCSVSFVYKDTLLRSKKYCPIEIIDSKKDTINLFFHYLGGVSAWNKLYKKELFKNISFPEGRFFEDAWVMYEIFDKCKKIVYDHKQLYLYTQRPDTIMSSVSQKLAKDWVSHNRELYLSKILSEYKEDIADYYLRICRDMKARLVFKKICNEERKKIDKILNTGIQEFCKKGEISSKTYKKAKKSLKISLFYVAKRKFAESNSNLYIVLKKIQYLFK